MNLLIKIYFDDINLYDIEQLLGIFKKTINNSGTTKIYLTTNDLNLENYDFSYLNKINVPSMINYKLDELDWDIVLPITRPCIISYNFDNIIKKKYEEKFNDLDGVLLLNDAGSDIKYPVVGRKYYDRFGYLYNPAYNKKNYEEEFIDILNINNKVYYLDGIVKTIPLKSDDDNIYEMRKKLNFGII